MTRRKFHPGYDRDFWDAVDGIRGPMRTGHPRDKTRDYFRYETVQSLMHPPAQLKDLVETSPKDEAIERAADMEENLLGKRPDRRVMYRSYKTVEREREEINQSPPPREVFASSSANQPTRQRTETTYQETQETIDAVTTPETRERQIAFWAGEMG